jgi:hypothetical protein
MAVRHVISQQDEGWEYKGGSSLDDHMQEETQKDRAWRKIVSLSIQKKKTIKKIVCINFDGEERRTLWILLLVYRQKWKRRRREGERR